MGFTGSRAHDKTLLHLQQSFARRLFGFERGFSIIQKFELAPPPPNVRGHAAATRSSLRRTFVSTRPQQFEQFPSGLPA
jgi:hypothetical protein